MAAKSNQWILFGFDLSRSAQFVRLGLHQILHDQGSWFASAFQPLLWVKVDEQWEGWRDTGKMASIPSHQYPELPDEACFLAASIPADFVLFKRFQFPESEEALLAEAIALEITVSSPFAEEEQIAGWKIIGRANAALEVLIGISSRVAAETALADLAVGTEASRPHAASVCALHEDGHLIEFQGYGDPAREQTYFAALRKSAGALGAVAALLCIAIALPVASSAYRSARLAAQYESIKEEALTVDRSVESLHLQRARLSFILEDFESRPDYASRLESIAATAPDGTFLEGLRIEGSEVEVTGYSDNAANYLRLLTEQEMYTSVNARSAFLREPRSGLERFTINWSFVAEES